VSLTFGGFLATNERGGRGLVIKHSRCSCHSASEHTMGDYAFKSNHFANRVRTSKQWIGFCGVGKEDEIKGCKTRDRWQSHYSSLLLSIIYHITPETKTKPKITIFASVDATKDQDGRKTSWMARQKDPFNIVQARFCWCLDS
jgi:hypothetical protein